MALCDNIRYSLDSSMSKRRACVAHLPHAYLDEAVSILRREVDGEVDAALRVLQREQRRAGVEEDATALAPHLSRLRDVLQREEEDEERAVGSEETATETSLALSPVHELDERRPQSSRATMTLDHTSIKFQRLA